MAFDRTNPTDLLTLKTEVNTDPISMGYNPTGSTQQLLNLLNDGDNNVGGETTGDQLTGRLLLDAMAAAPGDLTVGGQFTQGDLEFIKFIMEGIAFLDENIEQYRIAISGALTGANGIKNALDGQSRLQSRAEVLFGVGTVITRDDWFAARDS